MTHEQAWIVVSLALAVAFGFVGGYEKGFSAGRVSMAREEAGE